jgi:hypothetical protein
MHLTEWNQASRCFWFSFTSLDKRGNVNPSAGRREFLNLEGILRSQRRREEIKTDPPYLLATK